ncbi:methyltransferase [Klebsiella quasipneumoniae]|uniref:methyltransferase n=1 Tax=Klebsiella quasipneumoniae TaxID=1463165 RepID=UPI003D0332D3
MAISPACGCRLSRATDWQMFNDARRSLKYGGELYVVGNRHLDYFRKLKRAFGNCTTIATNNKFVILKATKVRKQR